MEPFKKVTSLLMPVDRANIDTDAIIPKQFLKSIQRAGFGPNLFDEWRYLDRGEPGQSCVDRPLNTEFVLNQPRYRGAAILLARENFGCGSSREHAPWALLDYGIRVIIAPSFADIFFNNCFKNGILPITLDGALVDRLFQDVVATEGYRMTVDLAGQTMMTHTGQTIPFTVDPFRRHCLLEGLDDIALTLQYVQEIEQYENQKRRDTPWSFLSR